MPYIIIDEKSVEFQLGDTILNAATKAGIDIPTLCHLPKTGHSGVCRICSVEVRGYNRFLPACSTHAEENMYVQTHSAQIVALRKNILAMIVAEGRHDCFMRDLPKETWSDYQKASMSMPHREHPCPSDGSCTLQKLVIKYGVSVKNLIPELKNFPLDNDYPMITRDFSRCVQCGRCNSACDAIQVNEAINSQFGRRAEKEDWWPRVDYTSCTHCGECLQHCPTGALSAKKAYGLTCKDDELKTIRTTCPYCGVGCQQELVLKDGRIIYVNGVEGAAPNQGSLCVKGRFGYDFIYSEDRLTDPLIRQDDGSFKAVSWDEALTLVAAKLSEAVQNYGTDSIAAVSCSRSINEDNYQMQKLFRSVLKTNNIDSCART